MRNLRNYAKAPVLTTSKLRIFVSRWKLWWKELQPTWRNMDEWPPTRTSDTAENDWSVLSQGGCNGLYLVVVSLGWWLVAAAKAGNEASAVYQEVTNAVMDVEWVFDQILIQVCSPGRSSSKRASPLDESVPRKKLRSS